MSQYLTILILTSVAVSGDSDSDNQALSPNEDVSLNNLIPAAPAALDPSSDLIPFSRYFKNQRQQHQSLHHTRKVKRFPGLKTSNKKKTSPDANISQQQILHQQPSRFSPDQRPVPRTPNLVLDDASVTLSHLELEDYFGTPETPSADSKENLSTESPVEVQTSKIRIKHKSDPFVAAKHKSVNPHPQEKNFIRPATKVKSNKRSSFHSLGSKKFISNPRPGQKPHKIRVSVKPKYQGVSKIAALAKSKIPLVETRAETEDEGGESLETKADKSQEIFSNPTTAASIIQEVTLHPGVTETVTNYYFTPTTLRTFENFKERNLPTRGSPLPIFKKSSGVKLNPVASQDSVSKSDLSHLNSNNDDKVVSNQDSNILAQKTDLLDKLRSLTGGQVVAVTLDRVHQQKTKKEKHKPSVPKKTKNVKKKQFVLNKIKDTSVSEVKKVENEMDTNINSVEINNKPSKMKFYQSDVKRLKRTQRKRQDRQLKDFASSNNVERSIRVNNQINADGPKRKSSFKKNRNTVGTVDRYKFENADGSITWGYKNEDGSFKEETIGVDCITHGRYGYVDPTGEHREYSYTSGIRCDPDTRKVKTVQGERGNTGQGYYDYSRKKFVLPNGRRVTVKVNQNNKARGRRY